MKQTVKVNIIWSYFLTNNGWYILATSWLTMGTSGCQLYPLLLIGPWKQCNLCYIQCFCICLWFLYVQHVSNVLLSFCAWLVFLYFKFFPICITFDGVCCICRAFLHLLEFSMFAPYSCIWSCFLHLIGSSRAAVCWALQEEIERNHFTAIFYPQHLLSCWTSRLPPQTS